MAELDRKKELVIFQERNCFHRATTNGSWISTIPHFLNNMGISWEEFLDNLRLSYRITPQNTPATCNGCGKNFLIEHALSYQEGGLVLAWHDENAK